MKNLLFMLLVAGLLFAQGSSGNIRSELTGLENTTHSFLGVMIFLCSLPLLLIAIVAGAVYYLKKKEAWAKWASFTAIGAVVLLFALILLYLLIPRIIQTSTGIPVI